MSRIIEILNNCIQRDSDKTIKPNVKIAVHDGKFHLDELVAITLINIVADKLGVTTTITRTRDVKILETQDIVLDVGCKNEGKYFDHHQRDFDLKHIQGIYEYTYASAGIIWNDLGYELLSMVYEWNNAGEIKNGTFDLIERKLIIPVDAIDNGEWKYKVVGPMPMMLPDIINNFNEMDPNLQEEGFHKALSMVDLIFRRRILLFCRSAVAVAEVGAEMRRQAENPNEHIFVMTEPGPWLSALQNNWEICMQFGLCVYPANAKKDVWNIQTFPAERDLRQSQRCSAPVAWRGWSRMYQNTNSFSPELATLMNQYGCLFIHAKGFMGAIRGTINTAKEFAKIWLATVGKERQYETVHAIAG